MRERCPPSLPHPLKPAVGRRTGLRVMREGELVLPLAGYNTQKIKLAPLLSSAVWLTLELGLGVTGEQAWRV